MFDHQYVECVKLTHPNGMHGLAVLRNLQGRVLVLDVGNLWKHSNQLGTLS
jgi:hypothetical protein